MALAAEEHHMDLAIDAAEETGRGLPKIKLSRTSMQVNTFGTTSVMIRLSELSKTTMKTKPSLLLILLVLLQVSFQLLTLLQQRSSNQSLVPRHGIQSSFLSTVKP